MIVIFLLHAHHQIQYFGYPFTDAGKGSLPPLPLTGYGAKRSP